MGRRPFLPIAVILLISTTLLITTLLIMPMSTDAIASIKRSWGGVNNEYGYSVAVDSSGGLYVTGYTLSFGAGGRDVFLLKYDSSGTLLWQRVWGGNNDDNGYAIAVDGSGNVYAAGSTDSFGAGGWDVLLLKFNSSGSLDWEKTWGGTGDEQAYGVAADRVGNVYLTGYTDSFSAARDAFLLKFNSSGALLWQKIWGGNSVGEGHGIGVDAFGNVTVSGYTYISGNGLASVFLLNFNSTGSLLWQRTLSGAGNDYSSSVALDSSNNIYVTGSAEAFGAGHPNVLILKLNQHGEFQWGKTWGGKDKDIGYGIAADALGDVYVTGATYSFSPVISYIFLLKLDSTGKLLSQKTWGRGYDTGLSVTVDPTGRAVIAGQVGEAPPHYVGTGNDTLGSPYVTVGNPQFAPNTPTGIVANPSGLIGTPKGNQTFGGGYDVVLLSGDFAPPPDLHLIGQVALLALEVVAIPLLIIWRRKSAKARIRA